MDPAVAWLLESTEPAIRHQVRRDLLGVRDSRDGERILDGPLVQALLAGQQADGGFGGHPYRKWTGAHWRLINLVELEVPAREPRALAALDRELQWLTGRGRLDLFRPSKDGLIRADASIEGSAVAIACRLGEMGDPRVRLLVEALLRWQWPDGGWNCHKAASGRRSSFHETHGPMWGLWEYARAADDADAAAAASRAAELFLDHRIYRRHGTGGPIHPSWVKLHYPPYWHYDVLRAMDLMARMGLAGDERAADAAALIESQRRPDGRWQPGGYWWHVPGGERKTTNEVVDWGRGGANEMITLVALRVLRAAGRWGKGSAS